MNFHDLEAEVLELACSCKGRIALYIETEEGIIQKNSDDIFSSASLIKVPILLAGLSQAEKGLLQLTEELEVADHARVGGSGVLQTMSKGLKLSAIDLMTLMIVVSDNTAANLVIDLIGKESINGWIKSCKLNSTELNRKMMDLKALKKGFDNKTTARDMAHCLKALAEHSLLSGEHTDLALRILDAQQFKNKLANSIDLENVQVASKTGELPGVEHDCAIFTRKGKMAIAAVLADQLKNQKTGREVLSSIGSRICRYMMED